MRPGVDLTALTVEPGEDQWTIWAGAVEGRLFRGEIIPGETPRFEQVTVTVGAEDIACGGTLLPCGRRLMGARFHDLHWLPDAGGGHLLGVVQCPGVLWFRPDGCGRRYARRAPLPPKYDLFRAVVDDRRITVVGEPGEILEIAR